MNMMMVAAAAGQGVNPALPSQDGMLFSFFLALAGIMLLTAAAHMARKGSQTRVVLYTRARRDLNNF